MQLVEAAREWPEHLGVGKPYTTDERMEDYVQALCYEKLGKSDEAMNRYQNIINFTQNNWTSWGAGHYISAIILKNSGDNHKALKLLQDWKIAKPEKDIVVQWALAKFRDDNTTAQDILKSQTLKTEGTPWNPGGGDRDFPVLLNLINMMQGE